MSESKGKKLPAIHQDNLDRWKLLLPKEPSDLVILKGHLLIEELLINILSKIMPNYSALKDARITFNQRLCIVRSLFSNNDFEKVFSEIKSLNKIRNSLSHNIEVTDFENTLSTFCSSVEEKLNMSRKYIQKETKDRLRFAIVLICGKLSIMIHDYDVVITSQKVGPALVSFSK